MVLIPISHSDSVLLSRLQLSQDRLGNASLRSQQAPCLVHQVGKVFLVARKSVQVDNVLIKKHTGDLASEIANMG